MRSALAKPCVVCGSAERELVVELAPDWQVARCSCGMHNLSPEPDAVRLEEFDEGSGYADAIAFHDEIAARYHVSLAAVERFVRPRRLLDVGCGTGVMLEVARARGWEAAGADPARASVERARSLGFEAHLGMLEDLDLAPGSFDAITLLQVVEHMPDARPLLAACRALLRDGGALLVATPNPASLLARAKRERFNYWIPPIHCAWYTPPALGRLLEGAGYELARSATWSPRTDKLHDGRDILDASRIGRRMPYRLKRRAADWVARAADATGNGTMTELVALKRGTR